MRRPTPSPPAGPLACNCVEHRSDVYAFRPSGTQDWLLAFTEAGRARFDFGDRRHLSAAGDILLIRPGTPHDYGVDEKTGHWKTTWAHFVPRSEALAWMAWPEVLPGHYALQLQGKIRSRVHDALKRMHHSHIGAEWRKTELAVNALEQALLLCDSVNPRHAETQRDPRILRAIESICHNLRGPLSIPGLALEASLSRSRFVQLFHREMGLPPRDFIEQRRLVRARELLEYSALTVAQAAEAVGFECPFYFSLRFKKHFGLSPRLWRTRHAMILPERRASP